MKTILSSAAVAALVALATPAMAQIGVGGGAVGGATGAIGGAIGAIAGRRGS